MGGIEKKTLIGSIVFTVLGNLADKREKEKRGRFPNVPRSGISIAAIFQFLIHSLTETI